jgi:hypothetical protein
VSHLWLLPSPCGTNDLVPAETRSEGSFKLADCYFVHTDLEFPCVLLMLRVDLFRKKKARILDATRHIHVFICPGSSSYLPLRLGSFPVLVSAITLWG